MPQYHDPNKVKKPSMFTKIDVYVSKDTSETLKRIAHDLGTTEAKLVCFAIDNELSESEPFYFPCEMPSTPFIAGAYIDDAQKISTYLDRFASGADIETLMLHRRDHGVTDKITFMLAIRELLENELFELRPAPVKPGQTRLGKPYLCFKSKNTPNDRSRKLAKLKSEQKKLQEQIERMEK